MMVLAIVSACEILLSGNNPPRNDLTIYHRRRVIASRISQLIFSEQLTSNMCLCQRWNALSSPRTHCHTARWCADAMKSCRRVLETERSDDFLLLRNDCSSHLKSTPKPTCEARQETAVKRFPAVSNAVIESGNVSRASVRLPRPPMRRASALSSPPSALLLRAVKTTAL
jgi:hypothetical protein